MSVYTYLDYRRYLRDWFEQQKREEPEFSHSVFAERAGTSRAALSNVMSGSRTPRSQTLDAFAKAMELDSYERDYLGLLVELDAATDRSSRLEVMERILSTERYGRVHITDHQREQDIFRLTEHWWISAVFELAGMRSFREDTAWIATTLMPPITEQQARYAIEALLDIGALERDSDGKLVRNALQIRSEPEVTSKAIFRFQSEVVPDMLRRIHEIKARDRHVLSGTLTFDPDLIPEIKTRLNNVFNQVGGIADDPREDGRRRVYYLGIQLLPLSHTVSNDDDD